MRGNWSVQTAVAGLCLLSVMVVLVSAECPNGCSGNGDCQSKDMCNCYMNYQGNDCADRTCLFGHAFVDTPKGDINMDKDRLTPGWLLKDSQQHPSMTYEHFNPDAIADEAHFYMECSNKGICDRSSGLCQCFDGYEGNGCRRMTCPSKCSGHGTCESIRELGLKAGGTLFGNEGAAGPVKYDLWDANSTYGCRCDPWYHGPDCGKRSCKVGVDPLFLSAGNPTYETFIIHASVTTGDPLVDAWIRLRLFDYHGESYITSKIPVTAVSADSAIVVANAIKAVPNLTFRKVTCEAANVGTNLANYKSTRATSDGFSVVCQFSDNPGKMRLPEFAGSNIVTMKSIVTTTQQGMDDEWFTTKTTSIVTTPFTPGLAMPVVPDVPLSPALVLPSLIKVGPHIALATAGTASLTLAYPLQATIGADTAVFIPQPGLITLTVGPVTSVDTLVGEDFLTFGADPTGAAHPIGSTLFFQNAFYTVQGVSTDTTNWFLKLDKPFPGGPLDGLLVAAGAVAYKVELSSDAKSKTYNYIAECSGRGMCGYDTGVCTCFKGYTNDNCDTQNILAL